MNEFLLYEQLLALQDIAGQYGAGQERCAHIRETMERVKTQRYRVAVIGEFKRGKSSLINAIIGAEVLPTDILPMTAAVTRVTYGEKRILIRYKDGRSEERTVEELVDFATKFDTEKEKTAMSIREIEVTYPSVFCKNHIDILDTPGLNDNESMTEVTLGVLGDVDAAIMVISAKAPLSLTEQKLILDMIGRPQIRHIIFVVTHIDAISNRPAQQDKMISFIRERLSTDLLEQASEQFASEETYLQKAQDILARPDIFGVSSVLAMDGFTQDDEELLEESRFPGFKKELLALLTAAQSEDVEFRTLEAAADVRDKLESWYLQEQIDLAEEQDTREYICEACRAYHAHSGSAMAKLLKNAEAALAALGITEDGVKQPELEGKMRKPFIQGLSQMTMETCDDEEALRQTLSEGAEKAGKIAWETGIRLESGVREIMMDLLDAFLDMREPCGFGDDTLSAELQALTVMPFPEFSWSVDPLQPGGSLVGMNVMPHINFAIRTGLKNYGLAVSRYVSAWRDVLTWQNIRDLRDTEPITAGEAAAAWTEMRRNLLHTKHPFNQKKLEEVLTALNLRRE